MYCTKKLLRVEQVHEEILAITVRHPRETRGGGGEESEWQDLITQIEFKLMLRIFISLSELYEQYVQTILLRINRP